MNKPHKHAALMLQYAQDAAETETPWERWEVRVKSANYWEILTRHPSWYDDCEYRRKPRTININGIEVPEPMREEPEIGTYYYIASLTTSTYKFKWNNDVVDNEYFNYGLCQSTREAAKLHANALLSFTKKEEMK